MEVIENKSFDEERSLYNIKDTLVKNCIFAGALDGESVLKETRNITVEDCSFSLRYPLWHSLGFELINSKMDDYARAPIWYASNGFIDKCSINSVKCLRESTNIKINNSIIDSKEFGWMCEDIEVFNSTINSEYLFMKTNNVICENIKMSGKYTFQYMNNLIIKNSYLDTKDAFWHSNNVTVVDSYVKGEYLGWFSNNLTLIRCHIVGTQPLCYCKNLKLVDCTMEGTDLSFEYSECDVSIIGHCESIKNPKSGKIILDSYGSIITDNQAMRCYGEVIIRK